MNRIVLGSELRMQGYEKGEIAQMLRDGQLRPVRRGAYWEGPPETGGTVDDRTLHRRLIEATVRQCRGQAVVSHMSAAVLHGLPIWTSELRRVHLTRNRAGGGRTRGHVVVRGLPYAPRDVERVDGWLTTTVPRTLLDLACQLPLTRSVPIGDAALRAAALTYPYQDLGPELDRQLADAVGRNGVPRARHACALFDARSESPGESYSRVRFVQAGLPAPELQFEVWTAAGVLLGRCDFAWPQWRTVGEFDGRVKYSGQFGEPAGEVLVAEKKREDRIRSAGWQVVRWTWDELTEPSALVRRINEAFARGRRAA